MHNIIGLHMIPNPDTGLVHEPTANCKCGPSKDSSVNPKVPIYKHKTVGKGNDRFKIELQTRAEA